MWWVIETFLVLAELVELLDGAGFWGLACQLGPARLEHRRICETRWTRSGVDWVGPGASRPGSALSHALQQRRDGYVPLPPASGGINTASQDNIVLIWIFSRWNKIFSWRLGLAVAVRNYAMFPLQLSLIWSLATGPLSGQHPELHSRELQTFAVEFGTYNSHGWVDLSPTCVSLDNGGGTALPSILLHLAHAIFLQLKIEEIEFFWEWDGK